MKKMFLFVLVYTPYVLSSETSVLNQEQRTIIEEQARIADINKRALERGIEKNFKSLAGAEQQDPRDEADLFTRLLHQVAAFLFKSAHKTTLTCHSCKKPITMGQKWLNLDCANILDGYFHPGITIHKDCSLATCSACQNPQKCHSSLSCNLVI